MHLLFLFLVFLSQACTCIIFFFFQSFMFARKKGSRAVVYCFTRCDVFLLLFKMRNAKERIKGYMQSGVKCGVHVEKSVRKKEKKKENEVMLKRNRDTNVE